MAVTLHYFNEFDKPPFQHITAYLWRNLCKSLLYFLVRVQCHYVVVSSRSLPHLLMSFLWY